VRAVMAVLAAGAGDRADEELAGPVVADDAQPARTATAVSSTKSAGAAPIRRAVRPSP